MRRAHIFTEPIPPAPTVPAPPHHRATPAETLAMVERLEIWYRRAQKVPWNMEERNGRR